MSTAQTTPRTYPKPYQSLLVFTQLMHPILSSLDETQHEWIKKLLFTFNAGDIGKFEALAPLFPKEPILQQNHPFLRQKICLMALIESVFRRNRDSRVIDFQTIATETRLDVGDVEHLVMKALRYVSLVFGGRIVLLTSASL